VAARAEEILFAELSPQSTAGTGTQCGPRGLTRGTAAHGLARGSARRAARRTTDNCSGLSLPLGRYGRARSAADRAANHSACVAADLLADGGPGRAAERTSKGGLAGGIARERRRHKQTSAKPDYQSCVLFHVVPFVTTLLNF
jgi:hypothetical protein